jgi:hypothetical protein
MIEVWNECQERETYYLSGEVISAILGVVDSARFVVDAELASTRKCGDVVKFRIRGTKGRTDWLKKRREDGKKGGRPKKTLGLTIGFDEKHPTDNPLALALALAPALAQKTTTSVQPKRSDALRATPQSVTKPSPLVNGERVKILQENFGTLYGFYPRHVGKAAAWKAFVKLDPDADTLRLIARDVKKRTDSGEWMPGDPERAQFIPHLSSYLNQQRWTDE